jgi:uncharacterized Zn-binding protein involved in type VI secretion
MPAAHRLGDICSGHGVCPPRPTIAGSENVMINMLNAQRIGDPYDPHCAHDSQCAQGSPDVMINNIGAVRFGDAVSCGGVANMASENVFING